MTTNANGRTFRQRLLSRLIIDPSGCILWTGSINNCGYGRITANGQSRYVHRLVWELFVGPVPDGLQLDHLCRVRHCANVAHLEPVSPRENVLRGDTFAAAYALKTHCPHGHEYTPANTKINRGRRFCRTCARITERHYRRTGTRRGALLAIDDPGHQHAPGLWGPDAHHHQVTAAIGGQ